MEKECAELPKVFFSEKSLEDRLGSEYEPIIFKALHTAKIFILVGTSKENIESNWVRNEWSRFIDRIKNEPQTLNGNNFIPVFKDMNPYDMPKVNNNFVQGVDANKLGYSITVLDGVQKMLKPEKEKKILDTFDSIENIEQFEKIRKQRKKELKQKNWKDLLTNSKKKKEKLLYMLFLASPLIFGLISLIFLFFEATLFFTNICFVLFDACLILTAFLTIAVICVQHKHYGIKPLLNAILPFTILGASILIFVLSVALKPITFDNRPAARYLRTHYDSGIIYYDDGETARIYGNTRKVDGLVKTIDNKKVLILPDTFKNKEIYQTNITLPDEVEVLVLPNYSDYCSIYVSKNSKLKEVYKIFDPSKFEYQISLSFYYSSPNMGGWGLVKDYLDVTLYCENTIILDPNSHFDHIVKKDCPYK